MYEYAGIADVIEISLSGLPGGFFSQKIDHFNNSDDRIFNQLFFSNDKFFVDGPELLFLGGTESIHIRSINNHSFPLPQYAQQLKSRVWFLEHRFFGASQPFSDYSTENLRYLTSDQAVEDAANFITETNSLYKVKSGHWIIFGGSIAGSLALNLRQKHFDLSIGAVASSYAEHCEDVYQKHSHRCLENIRSGFRMLREFMDNKEGRDILDEVFLLKPSLSQLELTEQQIQHFYYVLIKNFFLAVENNKLNKSPFNHGAGIGDVCTIMTSPAINPLSRLVKVTDYMRLQMGDKTTSLDIDYNALIDKLKNTTSPNDQRAFLWFQCYEFKRFSTTHYLNAFGSILKLNYFIDMCIEVFDLDSSVDFTHNKIKQQTLSYHKYGGTNTLILNHAVDPWSRLGMSDKDADDATVTILNLETTAHCADLYPQSNSDPKELMDARKQILTQMQNWMFKKNTKFNATKSMKLSKFMETTNVTARIIPDPHGGGNAAMTEDGWYYIEQEVDQIKSNGQKFNQTFAISFVNYQSGGPIFFALANGLAMTYEEFTDHTEMGYLAEEFGALMVLLEHRGYGSSILADEYSVDKLRFLTVEQTLADATVFIRSINSKLQLVNPKWITFGCSRAGALATWLRAQSPELTIGAVVSTPLMFPKVDVFDIDYNAMVLRLRNTKPNDARALLWQKCSELGSFATTDSGASTFGSELPVEFHLSLCRDVFGRSFTRNQIETNVKQLHKTYGDVQTFSATNLLVIESTNDPWLNLSIQQSTKANSIGEGITVLRVKDNSHCFDNKPPLTDPKNRSLFKAIKKHLNAWLGI
ncbi:Peptidase S28 family-containing protein [Aphelenchoides besseyi]|nr:Peptidase S28 family-containing protein [Aphelenchoides besseyi]